MTAHGHAAAPVGVGLIALVPLAIALLAYLAAALRRRPGKRAWNGWRTASFAAGIGLVIVAVSPPVIASSHGDLRVHMAQHIVLGMVAPLAIVLGAPMTLALRTMPAPTARRAVAVLRSAPVRSLTHPVTALFLSVGGMFLLYLTPLYELSLEHAAVHWLVHAHVLGAGALFAWSIVGPDPAPHRASFTVRLGALFVAMAAHAYLGKALYAHLLPSGVADAQVVREAAQLMYYAGDAAELLLLVALFSEWYRRRLGRQPARAARPVHTLFMRRSTDWHPPRAQ